jgi:hypothetical protein
MYSPNSQRPFLPENFEWDRELHSRVLRHSRLKARLKVPKCAQLLGVSIESWRGWEKGKYAPKARAITAVLHRLMQLAASAQGCSRLKHIANGITRFDRGDPCYAFLVNLFATDVPLVDRSWEKYLGAVTEKWRATGKISGFRSEPRFSAFAEQWSDPVYVASALGLPDPTKPENRPLPKEALLNTFPSPSTPLLPPSSGSWS